MLSPHSLFKLVFSKTELSLFSFPFIQVFKIFLLAALSSVVLSVTSVFVQALKSQGDFMGKLSIPTGILE